MKTETLVRLIFFSVDRSPDEITELTGLIPSKAWKIGDLISPRGTICYKRSGWRIQSTIDKLEDLDAHIKSIQDQIQSKWKILTEIAPDYEVELFCAVSTYNSQSSSIHFNKNVITLLYELNASINIDTAFYPEDND
jgi:hypothetical protein